MRREREERLSACLYSPLSVSLSVPVSPRNPFSPFSTFLFDSTNLHTYMAAVHPEPILHSPLLFSFFLARPTSTHIYRSGAPGTHSPFSTFVSFQYVDVDFDTCTLVSMRDIEQLIKRALLTSLNEEGSSSLSLTVCVQKKNGEWRMGPGCAAAIVSGYRNMIDLEEGSSSSSLTFFFYTTKNGEWRMGSRCTAAIVSGYDSRSRTWSTSKRVCRRCL